MTKLKHYDVMLGCISFSLELREGNGKDEREPSEDNLVSYLDDGFETPGENCKNTDTMYARTLNLYEICRETFSVPDPSDDHTIMKLLALILSFASAEVVYKSVVKSNDGLRGLTLVDGWTKGTF